MQRSLRRGVVWYLQRRRERLLAWIVLHRRALLRQQVLRRGLSLGGLPLKSSQSRCFGLASSAFLLVAAGCNCNLPPDSATYNFACPDDVCPTGESCVNGTCVAASKGGLAVGAACGQNADCASALCLGHCCESSCFGTSSVTGCMTEVFCSASDGNCHYPANGAACGEASCDVATQTETPPGTCAGGLCTPGASKSCPDRDPVCDEAGGTCVACSAPDATPCPAGTNCDATGACAGAMCSPDGGVCGGDGGLGCCTGLTCCASIEVGAQGYCSTGFCPL